MYFSSCFMYLFSILALMFLFLRPFGISMCLCSMINKLNLTYKMLCIPSHKKKHLFYKPRFILDVYTCVTKLCLLFVRCMCYVPKNENTKMFSLLQRLEYHTPMSFEQALAMGRTGILPSPVLNGYKPKGLAGGLPAGRHSDSDEEDWC